MDKSLHDKVLAELQRVSENIEKFKLAEYIELLNNPRRHLWLNFIGGLARGLGVAVGFTILGALVIMLLRRLMYLNLPLIGDFIADIVLIVQKNLKP